MKHIEQTIADLQAKVAEHEREVVAIKTTINSLCGIMGKARIYPDTDLKSGGDPLAFRADQFYGQPLVTSLRAILEARQRAGIGPAKVTDLHAALIAGGYKFNTADEQNAKTGLRISLRKNNRVFHRLPSGLYGLLEWYPGAKVPKQTNGDADGDESAEDADEQPDAPSPAPSGTAEPKDDGKPARVEMDPQ